MSIQPCCLVRLYFSVSQSTVIVHWREVVLLSGTAISVAGFAKTFFAGMFLPAYGFTLVGFICLFGAYYVRKYPTLKALEKTVESLKNTSKDLQDVNRYLWGTQTRLEQNVAQYKAENEKLQQHNQRLSSSIASLEQAASRISSQIDSFREENLKLRASIEGIDLSRAAFDQTVKEGCGHISEQFQRLEANIESTRTLSRQMIDHLSTEKSSLGTQLSQTNHLLSDLLKKDGVLEKFNALRKIGDDIRASEERLQKVNEEVVRSQTLLAAVTTRLEEVTFELESTAAKVDTNVEKLQKSREDIDASVAKLKKQADGQRSRNASLSAPLQIKDLTPPPSPTTLPLPPPAIPYPGPIPGAVLAAAAVAAATARPS
jgi:chromosome segregation ATPase